MLKAIFFLVGGKTLSGVVFMFKISENLLESKKNIGIEFNIGVSVLLFQLYRYTEIYDIP